MTTAVSNPAVGDTFPAVAEFQHLSLHYGKTLALDDVSLALPSRKLIGLIGPDGVGKSTLLSLITGAHAMQKGGTLTVLGGDMRDADHREKICPKCSTTLLVQPSYIAWVVCWL